MPKREKDRVSRESVETVAMLEDNELVSKLVAGHHEALNILFKRYSSAVFLTARRILGDSGEAEEVVQQTFLEMYQHVAEFDPSKGPFAAWLLKRATFRAVDRKDHLNVEKFYDWTAIDEAFAMEGNNHANKNLHRQEIKFMLDELLDVLPPPERHVIEWTFFQGQTAGEIAAELNDTVWNVRHLLYKALKRLRAAAALKRDEIKKQLKQLKCNE